jgi:hypothetical protein
MQLEARLPRRPLAVFCGWIALTSLACAVAYSGSAKAGDSSSADFAWETVPVKTADDVVNAIALDRSGRLAVGDTRGVQIDADGNRRRGVALRGAVQDLAFFDDGANGEPVLLAATTLGFYRVERDGRVESISPDPGPEASLVARIATAPGLVAVATTAGAFLSSDAQRWQRLSGAVPSGSASAIALRERADHVECWAAIQGELWRSEIRFVEGVLDPGPPVRVTIPFASGRRMPIDIAFDMGGADVAIVFDSELVVRPNPDEPWELLRPALPPGASARRLAAALGRRWLATDRGLLVAQDLRGPWRRVFGSAGSSAVQDLATGEGALYAATANGLAVARPGSSESSRAAIPPRVMIDADEPDIHNVHRAALRYLDLQPDRIAALRRGVARRGWLPIVAFRGNSDRYRGRGYDYDEAYVSGELRELHDSDRDKARDLGLQLTVSWDLGDIAYHPEAIDISREAREIIELRDDVLDEITQLYFERRLVLAEIASLSETAPLAEPVRADVLQLRAAQLAAGIDAWTGGWFSSRLSPPNP